MVKAISARWRVEEDFKTTKAMGLDQYEVRSWTGWSRHITLVMLASAFLTGMCAKAKAQVSLTSATCLMSKASVQQVQTESKPLFALTVAQVRHVLGRLFWLPSCNADFVVDWSNWPRHHGWLASFSHSKRRLDAG